MFMKVQNKGGKGNPNHDDETGEFSEANGGLGKKSKSESKTKKKKGKFRKKKTVLRLKENIDLGQIESFFVDINKASSVPLLKNAYEIYHNLDSFLSQKIVTHLDRYFGKSSSQYCSAWQFCPDPHNPSWRVSAVTCILGKYRYSDNKANLVTEDEYSTLVRNGQAFSIMRGVQQDVNKMIGIYTNSDIDNLGIYGNGIHGTNVYTSTSLSTASGYASRYGGGIIYGALSKDAKVITDNQLYKIQEEFVDDQEFKDSFIKRGTEIIAGYGIDINRAQELAKGVMDTIEHDISCLAIMLGYDYQDNHNDQHQYNILNLNKWYIRKDKR